VKTPRTVSVLLLQDHEDLGEVGKVVKVRPGHARNLLFPAGVACPVTPDALRRVARAQREAEEQRRREAAALADLATAIEGASVTLEERASEEGHLFGSVGAPQIVAALAERGIAIQEKQVQLEHPLKELGIFNVGIRVGAERVVEIRVWVVEPA
jgi:large subunit ribosomal protein L9